MLKSWKELAQVLEKNKDHEKGPSGLKQITKLYLKWI